MHAETESYFRRFGIRDRLITTTPLSELGLAIVIPCFNEPDLVDSLNSLWRCHRPSCAVEVIVVINAPADCSAEIRLQNQQTFAQGLHWMAGHADDRFKVHLLDSTDLPAKRAGVGLARKIGMDEALRRFAEIARLPEGVIVGFDADCRCEPNYLTEIKNHFDRHPHGPGCSIYFEHPLAGTLDARVYEAVAAYELHLRYYVQALRYTGFPYAHHTLGSCMAVRAIVYQKQGGMNQRKAGEDFYFLHKIMPLGAFDDLTTTTVIPSPRVSERVPFGTGKAVGDYLAGRQRGTYLFRAFIDLKGFFGELKHLFEQPQTRAVCSAESLTKFLDQHEFDKALAEIRSNTSSYESFQKRFFHWFNAFRVMKFLHYARDQFYGEGCLEHEARRLLGALGLCDATSEPLSTHELLFCFRELDRCQRENQ